MLPGGPSVSGEAGGVQSRHSASWWNNATILVNSDIKTGTGDVRISKVSGCFVDGNTKIGDKNINNSNADRKSDIILKIDTRVGDIDVN